MTRRTKNQEADMPRNHRLKPEIQNVIDPATEIHGKTCTDFISEASNHRAEGALLDQTVLIVSPEVYAEFLARLDGPAQPNRQLTRTMTTKAPWDET